MIECVGGPWDGKRIADKGEFFQRRHVDDFVDSPELIAGSNGAPRAAPQNHSVTVGVPQESAPVCCHHPLEFIEQPFLSVGRDSDASRQLLEVTEHEARVCRCASSLFGRDPQHLTHGATLLTHLSRRLLHVSRRFVLDALVFSSAAQALGNLTALLKLPPGKLGIYASLLRLNTPAFGSGRVSFVSGHGIAVLVGVKTRSTSSEPHHAR